MKVFDCFTFHNEFDILELRLAELWDTVDYFVIAEANITHQNKPKDFYLKNNWERFSRYHNKIRLISIEDMPNSPDSWVNERFQRRQLSRGLYDLAADDIVIVSDCDEVPRAEAIRAVKEDSNQNNYDRYVLCVPLFYFRLNYLMISPHTKQNNIAVARGRIFTDPQKERELTFYTDSYPPHFSDDSRCFIEHGGWHFTYFGQRDFAKTKLQSFAHAESNIPKYTENIDIDFMIENKVGFSKFDSNERFEYVAVDDYFPDTVLNNLEKYQPMIVDNAVKSVYDFYPE